MLSQPPYALAAVSFRFRALAALAGRLPLGGEREVAMALFVGARLADACHGTMPLSSAARSERAGGARHWLGAMTLPANARSAVLQLVDASASNDRGTIATAFERVVTIAAPLLDPPSRAEVKQLLSALEAAHHAV